MTKLIEEKEKFLSKAGLKGKIGEIMLNDLLTAQRQEILDEVVRLCEDNRVEEYYSCLHPICKENTADICKHIGNWMGYNSALNNMIRVLQEQQEKITKDL